MRKQIQGYKTVREIQEFRFMKCINKNCSMLHLVKLSEIDLQNDSMLCNQCKDKRVDNHIIVCIQCKSIIDFIPTLHDEMPKQLHVKRCEKCGGTIDDEIELVGEYFNDYSFNRY